MDLEENVERRGTAEDGSMDEKSRMRRRHMTLRARSLCFPIILRVFDTTTCYVNTSTRRHGQLIYVVMDYEDESRPSERERDNSFYLATVQRIIDSRVDFRLSTLCARLSPTYFNPTDFSSFHLQFLPPLRFPYNLSLKKKKIILRRIFPNS